MSGYYTVKLVGAEGIALPERMRLETAYAAQLEALVGGPPVLMALCEAARSDGAARQRLREAGHQAELRAKGGANGRWPAGARFTLSLWSAQDL